MLLKKHNRITIQMRCVNHDDRMRVFRYDLNQYVGLKRVVIDAGKQKIMG